MAFGKRPGWESDVDHHVRLKSFQSSRISGETGSPGLTFPVRALVQYVSRSIKPPLIGCYNASDAMLCVYDALVRPTVLAYIGRDRKENTTQLGLRGNIRSLLTCVLSQITQTSSLAEYPMSMSSEISHALFVDLTKPETTKEFPATDLSKTLIEWVGLDVVRFRRNQQVAYRIVDHCRETYDRIIGVIDKIDQTEDEEVDYDQFDQYTDALDALEE